MDSQAELNSGYKKTKRQVCKDILAHSTSLNKKLRAARKLKQLAVKSNQKSVAGAILKDLTSLQEMIKLTIGLVRKIKKLDRAHGEFAEKAFCATKFTSMSQILKFKTEYKINKCSLSKLMLDGGGSH